MQIKAENIIKDLERQSVNNIGKKRKKDYIDDCDMDDY